jgi:hypothetical protein
VSGAQNVVALAYVDKHGRIVENRDGRLRVEQNPLRVNVRSVCLCHHECVLG